MAVQLSCAWLNGAAIPSPAGPYPHCRSSPSPTALSAAACAPFPSSSVEIVGGKTNELYLNESSKFCTVLEGCQEKYDWNDLETDLYYWTKQLRPVQVNNGLYQYDPLNFSSFLLGKSVNATMHQVSYGNKLSAFYSGEWYPGHIAKTEKELKEQLKLMDVVIEVRDARIPMSTSHPQMDSWLGTKKRILVLNREDMVSVADRNAWAAYFASQGIKVVFSNGQLGMGTMKLSRLAKTLAGSVNIKRRAKGLLPRPEIKFRTATKSRSMVTVANCLSRNSRFNYSMETSTRHPSVYCQISEKGSLDGYPLRGRRRRGDFAYPTRSKASPRQDIDWSRF